MKNRIDVLLKKRIAVLVMLSCLLFLCAAAMAQEVTLPTPSLFGIDPNVLTIGLGLLTTLLTSFFNKRKYSTSETYFITYGVCAVLATIGGLVTKNITGAALSGGQWFAAFLMVAGAANGLYAILRIKLNLLRDGINGGDITLPTTKEDAIADAEAVIKWLLNKYGFAGLISLVTSVFQKNVKVTPGTIVTQAGTAGAVPAPSTAPLVGGSTIDTSTPVNPSGMAAQAELAAVGAHASTGQNVVVDPSTLPVVPLTTPPITPSPEDQAKIAAITNAIATGQNAEMVVNDGYNPQAD